MNQNKVIIISGPTACGKTGHSIILAKKFNLPIINFDSLLFYSDLNIGTAKPTAKERGEVPHYMIDISTAAHHLNAADYAKKAGPLIDSLLETSPVILVGGSGFYIRALAKGMYPSGNTSPDIQDKSDELYKRNGIQPFLDILAESDPESLESLHRNDHYRLRRAVEHLWNTGRKLSLDKKQDLVKHYEKSWSFHHLYLDIPKEEHLPIIAERTKQILKNGLVDEVRNLLNEGHTGKEKPLQSIGYKEALDYVQSGMKEYDQLEEAINISTRQLAKAQRTWFKKVDKKHQFHPLEDKNKIVDSVSRFLAV